NSLFRKSRSSLVKVDQITNNFPNNIAAAAQTVIRGYASKSIPLPSTGKNAVSQKGVKPKVEFEYQDLFETESPSTTPYYKLEGATKLVSTVKLGDKVFVEIQPDALRILAQTAMRDIAHLLRPGHLQ